MILDGQQRLTSVLLAYLGKFPKRKIPVGKKKYADENDLPTVVDADDDLLSEWTFKDLLQMGNDKDSILAKINADFAGSYTDFVVDGVKINDSFLLKHFIHFAYLVPDSTSSDLEKSKYLSNVFHSINREGTKLNLLKKVEPHYITKVVIFRRNWNLISVRTLLQTIHQWILCVFWLCYRIIKKSVLSMWPQDSVMWETEKRFMRSSYYGMY